MIEQGTVERIESGWMQIRMERVRPEMCKKCHACDVLGEDEAGSLSIPAAEGVVVGDRVEVDLPEANPWLSIVLVLGLPVLLVVGGLVLGSRWGWWVALTGLDAEMAGVVLGVGLGAAAFFVARAVDRRYHRNIHVRRVGEPADAGLPGE